MAFIDYPNLTTGLVSDGFPDKPNGWFLKHLDDGSIYHRVAGEWVDWELGLSFAPPTKSGDLVTDEQGDASVVFGTPFFDDIYSVALTCSPAPNPRRVPVALLVSKTSEGFTIKTVNAEDGRPLWNVKVSWLCTQDFNE